jgi:hypothetical protein
VDGSSCEKASSLKNDFQAFSELHDDLSSSHGSKSETSDVGEVMLMDDVVGDASLSMFGDIKSASIAP